MMYANDVCHLMLMKKCLLAMLMLMLVILMLILLLLNLNTGYPDADTDLCIRYICPRSVLGKTGVMP